MGDDNPNTIPKIGYDFLAAPSAEVQAIGAGKPPSHITRAHNMPLDILPAIDHNPEKAAGAPAFFMAKTCDSRGYGRLPKLNQLPVSMGRGNVYLERIHRNVQCRDSGDVCPNC
jgi:hypothetical protein